MKIHFGSQQELDQESVEEAELIQLARQGDLVALNQLVLKYQCQAFSQAYRLFGNEHDAEDITQDAFLLAFRKIYQYRGGCFQAWLLKIVTNLCYDEMRSWKRALFLPLEPVNEDGETNESPYWIKDSDVLPEESVEMRQLHEEIESGLRKLPVKFRIAVILVDIQELSYQEAAFAMSTSIGTLKSRLARGRLMLRNVLVKMYPAQDLIYQFTRSQDST
jgi:RNA polymerase sigma-70 factor (ECF subfamily)